MLNNQFANSLVTDDCRGTLTCFEAPPSLASLTAQDTSFILPF